MARHRPRNHPADSEHRGLPGSRRDRAEWGTRRLPGPSRNRPARSFDARSRRCRPAGSADWRPPFPAVQIAVAALVGQAVGPHRFELAETVARRTLLLLALVLAGIVGLTFLFVQPIAALFIVDPELAGLGATVRGGAVLHRAQHRHAGSAHWGRRHETDLPPHDPHAVGRATTLCALLNPRGDRVIVPLRHTGGGPSWRRGSDLIKRLGAILSEPARAETWLALRESVAGGAPGASEPQARLASVAFVRSRSGCGRWLWNRAPVEPESIKGARMGSIRPKVLWGRTGTYAGAMQVWVVVG